MKAVKASGSCADCGRYSEATGADEEDARILLNHEHGHEYEHCYNGDVTFKVIDTNKQESPCDAGTARQRMSQSRRRVR